VSGWLETSLRLECSHPGICHFYVLRDRAAARADAANDLAIDYERHAAAQQRQTRLLQEAEQPRLRGAAHGIR
jgi:hypothetical protein